MLPFDRVGFVLQLTDDDRVVLVEPGERRPVAELPVISVAGTALARVLHGELPCAFAQSNGVSRMIVPLRVAGKVHGVMILSARQGATLSESHVLPAQRLADVMAAYVELMRRR